MVFKGWGFIGIHFRCPVCHSFLKQQDITLVFQRGTDRVIAGYWWGDTRSRNKIRRRLYPKATQIHRERDLTPCLAGHCYIGFSLKCILHQLSQFNQFVATHLNACDERRRCINFGLAKQFFIRKEACCAGTDKVWSQSLAMSSFFFSSSRSSAFNPRGAPSKHWVSVSIKVIPGHAFPNCRKTLVLFEPIMVNSNFVEFNFKTIAWACSWKNGRSRTTIFKLSPVDISSRNSTLNCDYIEVRAGCNTIQIPTDAIRSFCWKPSWESMT